MADNLTAERADETVVTAPAGDLADDALADDVLVEDVLVEDVLVEDVLVEEVSIDGMCGVY
jgi:mycofactocin precursor